MAVKRIVVGALALVTTLTAAGVAPASAEFFGCKEPHTKVTYSQGYLPRQSASRNPHSYAAGRAHHAAYSSHSYAPHQAVRRADRW